MNNGEEWANRWIFKEPLGGGGQGETSIVISRNDPSLTGVLKCLRKNKELDPKARLRMLQEVTNLRVLHGSGAKVPSVLDDNTAKAETTEPLFFVMELISGRNLAQVIETNTLDLKTAIDVTLDLCETIKYAATAGIVHRDIKPENIVVRSTSPADVVMVDFGIASNESDPRNPTEVGETFDNKFISLPERRGPDENKRDPRSDLTGLCAILHFCLTGCVPRNLRDSNSRPPHRWVNYTIEKAVENEVQRSLLNAFFDRGFSWEIDARFQTIDEFISRLSEIANPNATLPSEDLVAIALRESALLRKTDRKSQISDFQKTIAAAVDEDWHAFIKQFSNKLDRFTVAFANDIPLGKGEFGDLLRTLSIRVGVQNHKDDRIIGYHFCSIGEECSIVRKIETPGRAGYQRFEDPCVIARYNGDYLPPIEILKNDVRSTVGRLICDLRIKIGEKSSSTV